MNKQTITFTASEQTLTKTGGIEHYASNIVSYIEASFTLGDNWAGYDSIRAVWESGYARIATVLDANNKCIVPAEVLTYKSKVNVNLVGSIVENTVLTDRLTTYPILALTVDADARVDSSETTPVTASQFEQFVDAVRDEASAIQNYTYDSEAWAVGQRAGVDVPSTDETYQNNAKYYADQGATLQQEVTDLKSALIKSYKKSNVYTLAWLNKGNNYVEGYLKSDGSVGTANDAYVTDYFEVVAGEPIIIRMDEGYTGSSIHVCFYNSSKTLVDYAGYSMDRRKCVGKTVPSTAKYCRFDYVKTFPNPTAEQTLSANIMPKEKNTAGTVIGEIKSTPTIVGSQALAKFVVGWLKESDGTVTGNEALTSSYIPLMNNNPLVKWGNHATDTTTQICFYGADLSFIQTSSGRDKTIAVPDGAVYFSYTIDDSWTDADYYIMQNRNVGVPTKEQLAVQGVHLGMPLNIKYRGLLVGFGNNEIKLRTFGTRNFDCFEQIGLPFKPEKGNRACRDPFIMIYGDWYYIFYTDTPSFTTDNNDIGVCRTMDFVSYEEFSPIVCNENFKVCWAPSVYEENGNYYLTVTGSTLDYSETYTYMYDLDMDTLAVSNERVIAVGASTRQLDFHFMKVKGQYYAVGKYDNTTTTVIGVSSSLNGPYTVLANQKYSNKPEEGPQMLRLDNGAYRLYINDYFTDQVIHYVDIPDIANPTQGVGSLKTITHNSPVPLFHTYVIDFNRAWSFDEN